MTVPRQPRKQAPQRTPADRAAALEEQTNKVRRRYKTNLKTRRKFAIQGEEELVKDMIIVLKLANYTHSQIGSIVGVSRGQVGEYLQDEKLQAKMLHLREALPAAALELGKAYLIEAVQAVVHVLRTEKDNALVLKAASELFDRFGLPKLTRQEAVVENTNTFGDSDESLISKFRTATPEMQEKAAQLHEMFEEGLKNILTEGENGGANETD
jgi:hypothetical protein